MHDSVRGCSLWPGLGARHLTGRDPLSTLCRAGAVRHSVWPSWGCRHQLGVLELLAPCPAGGMEKIPCSKRGEQGLPGVPCLHRQVCLTRGQSRAHPEPRRPVLNGQGTRWHPQKRSRGRALGWDGGCCPLTLLRPDRPPPSAASHHRPPWDGVVPRHGKPGGSRGELYGGCDAFFASCLSCAAAVPRASRELQVVRVVLFPKKQRRGRKQQGSWARQGLDPTSPAAHSGALHQIRLW